MIFYRISSEWLEKEKNYKKGNLFSGTEKAERRRLRRRCIGKSLYTLGLAHTGTPTHLIQTHTTGTNASKNDVERKKFVGAKEVLSGIAGAIASRTFREYWIYIRRDRDGEKAEDSGVEQIV